jgi:diguanylate cyclase (GGDEF)-like protein
VSDRPAGDISQSRASWTFDLIVSGLGLLIAALSLVLALKADSPSLLTAVLVGAPLVGVLGYFDIRISSSMQAAVEPWVSLESAGLIFLVCRYDARSVLLAWVVGHLILAVITPVPSIAIRFFNFGLFVTSGVVALWVLSALGGIPRDGELATGHIALTISAASVAYILFMYTVLTVSVTIEERIPLRNSLSGRHIAIALSAIAAINTLGYLAVLMSDAYPLWTMVLFSVPVVAVMMASHLIARSAEQRERLATLFDAAKQIQLSATYDDIMQVLTESAPRIMRNGQLEVRDQPPAGHHFGVQVRNARSPLWIVDTGTDWRLKRSFADREALKALATMVEEALLRTSLAAEMNRMAYHDALTGLPNRKMFLERAELAVAAAQDADGDVAVLFLDLDGFKAINDRYGHGAGDALLVEVAGRLRGALRDVDLVGRIGGDEFAVLIERVASVDDLFALADRIIDSVGRSIVLRGQHATVGASIGIALASRGDDSDALIDHADTAMYDAKGSGKNCAQLYQPPGVEVSTPSRESACPRVGSRVDLA